MTEAHPSHGIARFVGDAVELAFPHDLHIVQQLNGLGAKRLGMGVWRVPQSQLAELSRRLEPFNFTWEGDAESAHDDEVRIEQRLRREDDNALLIKSGHSSRPPWDSPVQLLDHQRLGVEFLAARSSALLCDEQGLGKTLTALTAFWLVRKEGTGNRLVVICPNSLKHNWRAEITKFFPEWRVTVVTGSKAARRRAYFESSDVYIANYESARGDYSDIRLLLRRTSAILICDESHFAKNSDSRTAKALAFVRSAAERVWVMSGTPIPNKLDDAYAQVFTADGGRLLGSREAFRRQFGGQRDPMGAAQELNLRLEPVMLRRTKEEVLDLPEKVFEERHVELRGRQRDLYNAYRGDLYEEISSLSPEEYRGSQSNVLTRLLRLSQIASNPRLVVPSFDGEPAKFTEIDALLEELIIGNGRKVVLWSYYVRSIEEFLRRYERYDPVAIYGSVGMNERTAALERFQEDPSCTLFIGNPQAAGTGLTLTASSYAIYETLNWRFDLYAQSLDRIHRIGQTNSVTYFNVLAAESIDLEIIERLEKKRVLAGQVLGDFDRGMAIDQAEALEMIRKPLS